MPRATPILTTALVLLSITALACGASARMKTLEATVISVDTARDGFLSWNKSHEQAIVASAQNREQALSNVAAYYEARGPVVEGFQLAYRAIALAATKSDDTSLKTALEAAKDLLARLQALTKGP